MNPHVVDQFETAIQAGGVDVLVEICQQGDGPLFAQVAVTDDELDSLDLSLKDVEAIHLLTGSVLAAMSSTGGSDRG
jgi:hypothetical protein